MFVLNGENCKALGLFRFNDFLKEFSANFCSFYNQSDLDFVSVHSSGSW